MLAYLVCHIDRVNAGFAALRMNKDIGLSGTVFGLGGGICLVDVAPANRHDTKGIVLGHAG